MRTFPDDMKTYPYTINLLRVMVILQYFKILTVPKIFSLTSKSGNSIDIQMQLKIESIGLANTISGKINIE